MIKLNEKGLIIFLSFIMATFCHAENKAQSAIKQQIERAMPSTSISSVNPSVIPGVYEIEAGKNIYYTDATGRYLVVGHIYDLETASDLTQQRLDRLLTLTQKARVDFSEFPADAHLQLKQGRQLLTVLFDPNCGWCKKLYRDINQLKDTAVNIIFSVPEQHVEVTANILCSDKPLNALTQVMSGKPLDERVETDCIKKKKAALAEVNQLMASYGLSGTPILIAQDGRVHPGYLPILKIQQWLM